MSEELEGKMSGYSVVTSLQNPATGGEVIHHGRIAQEDIGRLNVANQGYDIVMSEPPEGDAYYSLEGGAWVVRPPRPGATFIWNRGLQAWEDTRTLLQRQDAQWEVIKQAEREADAAPFTMDGHVFQAGPNSRKVLAEAAIEALMLVVTGGTTTFEWTLANDSRIALTEAQVLALARGIGARGREVHDKAQLLRAQIYASTTPESIAWDGPGGA